GISVGGAGKAVARGSGCGLGRILCGREEESIVAADVPLRTPELLGLFEQTIGRLDNARRGKGRAGRLVLSSHLEARGHCCSCHFGERDRDTKELAAAG